jgi:RNA recognition motif-containing protein
VIAEGRRIYVGNLPYRAKEEDVMAFFHERPRPVCLPRSTLLWENRTNVEISTAIDISIDPFNGRNPSYCFVEFDEKAQADRAMQELNGRIFMGRPLKIKPCVPKIDRPNGANKSGYVFDRWERTDASGTTEGIRVKGAVYMLRDSPSLQHSTT